MNEHKKLEELEDRLEKIATNLERMKLADYVDIINNPKKLLYTNFIGGLARGLGTAIGLTALAAVLFYIMRQTVNLPLIGQYIANLLDIIENYR
ncbi:DUF5665 domain-containing protein [Geosporobacter ferrireducens]|uniref:Uncharacterized protein n=1 Tax=Geosporobacter ferrireducens TaxID=1424294 RepID=A0A1D8GBZ8_9FIRM|nr:DUF5665 domain-containing protein [Geosporobacter ferrireducens]AOT68431.1 hypothetical protein Gferi_01785 [Geosporobacter ferrireducens]MTI53887.1 hypothetical protein [Geosporobacter ferrireducens]